MNAVSLKTSVRRSAALIGLAVLGLLVWGCSKGSGPEQAKTEQKQATAQAPGAVTQPAAAVDEELPPALRTPWKGDLDAMVQRRVVRVLLPFSRPTFFYMEGRPAGVLYEAFQELERVLNAKYKTTAANRIIVALLPTPIDKLRDRMLNGYGDIAAYTISITEENKAVVDFTIPTMTGLKMVVVTGPGAPELKSIEDLSGKEVWISAKTRQKADFEALNSRLTSRGRAPAVMREVEEILEPGDVMEMVNAGIYPIALMQSMLAEFWGKVFDNVRPRMDLAVAENMETGWAIQKGTPKLKAFLDDFLTTHGMGTAFGNTVLRRYLKEAKYVRNATDPSEIKKFRALAPIFTKYGTQYDLESLLLVAQGYQESQLDQKVKSPVGAVGIMQVMPATAAGAPVKIPDIQSEENNIHAGVRLLHFLVTDYFNEPGLDKLNRTLFAIAAYNAGPAQITRCRQLAEKMGYDRNKWFGNVEVAVAKVVGRETTQYVANIYKYYVAYRMARATQTRKEIVKKKAMGGKPGD